MLNIKHLTVLAAPKLLLNIYALKDRTVQQVLSITQLAQSVLTQTKQDSFMKVNAHPAMKVNIVDTEG